MLSAFPVSFQKVHKSCLLLLVALLGSIDTLCKVVGLKVPAMIVYDVATKVLDTEVFPQHTIADLTLALHLLFCSVRRSLYGERK